MIIWGGKPSEVHESKELFQTSVTVEYWPDVKDLEVKLFYQIGTDVTTEILKRDQIVDNLSGGIKATYPIKIKTKTMSVENQMTIWITAVDKKNQGMTSELQHFPIRLVGD